MVDEKERDEEGRGPRISIKLDGTTITALIALLSSLGFGTYNQVTQVSNDHVDNIGSGVVEAGEASKDLASKTVKLAALLKVKEKEIDEIYSTTDWLIDVVEEFGKKHPVTWRQLRRDAPDHISLGDDEERSDKAEESPGVLSAEELYEEVSDTPILHQFPALDQIRRTIRRGK